MKLIVGLGNIGPEYEKTRHNVGFWLLDILAEKHDGNWSAKPKFKALSSEIEINGEKVLLLKPTTYYNLSGEAVRAVKDFYKIENSDILAVHDELALPFGTIRARVGGSDAGNNGIKSLLAHIGTDFTRLRVGIANDFLPRTDAADFVLTRFSADEQEQLLGVADHTLESIGWFIDGSLEHHTEQI